MIQNLAIMILVDNQAGRTGLLSEHGLSLWIEADNRRILFDTGQSDMLVRNAEGLGIDLRTADTLVLSHGHYDHTGGVARFLAIGQSVAV
jgi:7,8-dihydropterin-6-yl-methyl-4-(beta-D-ribofuranosyl)aminobenzene 5'-phosphate synthase